ncbi:hypothetical protein RvY_08532 [Ramazzottius varieornatus]|uniref:Receptor ligand binding region domain-containing protein n=1 Tax=Ramazzottius varieornatus TaxID=947166 RepID=A0A1D1V8G1_RAMVA|nr:hypothetical protein RvY_08532 [Ramazzottius varieornatus]
MEPAPLPLLNLTIVTYVLYPAVLLSSRPFIGPALDMAGERLRYLFNFNVTVEYIGSYNWSTVQGMVDNVYLVHQFYEKTWDRNGVVVLLTPGTDEVSGLGDLAREQDSLLFTT